MKNYSRKHIVIMGPIIDEHRRRLFEIRLQQATVEGYAIVGQPHFFHEKDQPPISCVVLLKKASE